MLTLTEQLLLLLIDRDGDFLPLPKGAPDFALSGAALMDLAFAGRIDTDLTTLIVIDGTPTGDAILDPVLARIAARPDRTDARTWIPTLAIDEAAGLRERGLTGLVDRGLLERRDARILGMRRGRRYPPTEAGAAAAIGQRIGQVLLSDDIPDPRDIALISLIDACDILADILPEREYTRGRRRVVQLRRLDLIGREVAGGIAVIRRTLDLAVRGRAARLRNLLLYLSCAAGLAALVTLLAPRIAIPDRFGPTVFERLWFDGIWLQWSGYLLLGFTGAGLLALQVRRLRPLARRAGYAWWQLGHVTAGACCLLLLFGHTGFRLGSNLNAALMLCYVAALLFGAMAGITTGGSSLARKWRIAPKWRSLPLKLHIAALCPLPALLIAHLLIVYLY